MWIKLTPVKHAKQSPLYLRNIPCTWQIVCLLMRSARSDCLILYIMHDRHFTWTWAYNNKIYDAYIVWSKSYSRDHALSASNKTHVASLMVGMHVSIQVAHDEVSCVWCTRSPIFHISPFLCRVLKQTVFMVTPSGHRDWFICIVMGFNLLITNLTGRYVLHMGAACELNYNSHLRCVVSCLISSCVGFDAFCNLRLIAGLSINCKYLGFVFYL